MYKNPAPTPVDTQSIMLTPASELVKVGVPGMLCGARERTAPA